MFVPSGDVLGSAVMLDWMPCRDIREIVEGPPQQLIEAVAERIAGKVLREHPSVAGITVSVVKPHVAVGGVLESLGVEITRQRQAAEL